MRKSIEEDYAEPQGFVSREEREKSAKKAAERQQQQEQQRKVEKYEYQTKTPPEKLIYGDLFLWEKNFKKKNGRPPTKQEKSAQQKELIRKLPTNKELQEQLFGRVLFAEGKSGPT